MTKKTLKLFVVGVIILCNFMTVSARVMAAEINIVNPGGNVIIDKNGDVYSSLDKSTLLLKGINAVQVHYTDSMGGAGYVVLTKSGEVYYTAAKMQWYPKPSDFIHVSALDNKNIVKVGHIERGNWRDPNFTIFPYAEDAYGKKYRCDNGELITDEANDIDTINDPFITIEPDGTVKEMFYDDGTPFIALTANSTSKPEDDTKSASALPTASTVLVNGQNTGFDAYNIDGSNYFKLRDLAYVLSGSAKQFEVGWDGEKNAISLTSGKAYTVAGGEMAAKGAGNKTALPTSSKIYIDGKEVALTAYNIDGNNYFKLRDIGQAFDFGVDWDAVKNTIVIDTTKGYTP